jgi:hypothetical protein
MAYIYNMADTWADAGVTFTAIKMNVLDTASNAASLLMDLQVGGGTRFNIRKNGLFLVGASGSTQSGFEPDSFALWWTNNGTTRGGFLSTGQISLGDSSDVRLWRDAANTLAQRNGTNAQTFRVYNTFTDASNYERGKMEWASNVLRIGTEKAGTGTARALDFQTDGATRFSVSATLREIIFNGDGRISRQTGFGGIVFDSGNNITVGVSASAITCEGYLQMPEQTAPAAPAADRVRIYAEDNGSGKTRLMARFATGAAVQIAIEP